MDFNNSELVYSTDPQRNQRCPKCRHLTLECVCPKKHPISKSDIVAVLRIEKSGRKGKTVTVIDRLPNQERYLKELAKTLKTRCGAGGTYLWDGPFGQIEIQGDKREMLRTILAKEGIRVKG